MGLVEGSDLKHWPASHYVFLQKIGPFMQTAPACWQEFHQKAGLLMQSKNILSVASLYKIQPQMVYRAGVMLSEVPASLPEGFSYEKFEGGLYSRFILKGSYAQLPEACGRVFQIVEQTKLPLRDDFYIENYVNDPRITPEDQLITELLIPTRG